MSKHWLLEGTARELMPSSIYHVRVKPTGAEVPLRFTVPLKGRYDGVPPLSPDPAVAVQQSGKGTVVYFAGDFGNTVATFHLPEFLHMAANAAGRLAPSPVQVENLPGSVEVVWRSQQDGHRKLLHLVNFTGEMTRPITRVLPLINVRVKAPAATRAAHTLMRPRTLPITDGVVVIPRVDEYEVVVFEP